MSDVTDSEKRKLVESWVETLQEDLEQFKKEVKLRLDEKRDKETYYNKQLQRYISRVAKAQKRVDDKSAQLRKVTAELNKMEDEK